jgi:putative nucleotidyltransferase with HDIG domain
VQADRRADEMEELNLRTIETLITSISAAGYVTKVNVRRVERLVSELGRAAGCTGVELKALRIASLLHDVGNIALPQHILMKPGALTSEEFNTVKGHTTMGAKMVESIGFPYPVAEIITGHHERFDGTGYPNGLRETQIPIGARVLSIVDYYVALTMDRPYRLRYSRRQALEVMKEQSGKAFDPALLGVFFGLVEEADEDACRVQAEALGLDDLHAELLGQRRHLQAVRPLAIAEKRAVSGAA